MDENKLEVPAWIGDMFAGLPEDGPGEVAGLRRKALDKLLEGGFPSAKIEDWKHTNLAPLLRLPFARPAAALDARAEDLIPAGGENQGFNAVFVNGLFRPELSTWRLEPGVEAAVLSKALSDEKHPMHREACGMLRAQVDGSASSEAAGDDAFALLNGALMQDGLILCVAPNALLKTPITVTFAALHAGGEAGPRFAVFPRLLLKLGRQSQCTVIEKHISSGAGEHLSAGFTTVEAEEGAVVDHVRLQDETDEAYHFSFLNIAAGVNASVRTNALSFGGQLVRNQVYVLIGGSGASAELNGLTVLAGRQQADNHTVIDHAEPHGESREAYKGIYDEHSRGNFDGTIIVRPGAQKTSAVQSNRSLLLSNDALSNSKPQLKIWADDVKCTHGAAVGQLDDEALFYMQSRGIPRLEAQRLLTEAFAADIVDKLGDAGLRNFVLERLQQKLGGLGAAA